MKVLPFVTVHGLGTAHLVNPLVMCSHVINSISTVASRPSNSLERVLWASGVVSDASWLSVSAERLLQAIEVFKRGRICGSCIDNITICYCERLSTCAA